MHFKNGISEYALSTGSGLFAFLGSGSWANFQADRLYKSNDTYQFKCTEASRHIKREEVLLPVAVRRSKTPELKLNFIRGNENVTHFAQSEFSGRNDFFGGIFCLEYPSRRSEKVNCHFVNYRLSFRKLQIIISQTADFHFANYRFSFRKRQIFISFRSISFRFAPFRFANYSKPPSTQLSIGQIEASTSPPPPGKPGAFDIFAVPGRREFDY